MGLSFTIVFVFLAFALIVSEVYGELPDWAFILVFVFFVVFFVLLFTGVNMVSGVNIIRKNRKRYKALPFREVTDYKAELEEMRKNFAADNSDGKNEMPKSRFIRKGLAPYYDFGVLRTGNVYYGYLVEANSMLFTDRNFHNYTLPAVFIYSRDEYYAEHPQDLQPIAEELFDKRHFNILRHENEYFSNIKIDNDKCGGREVYMTTVFVYRPFLPRGYISSYIVPLIADPEHSTSVIILEEKFWSHDFACNFANNGILKKRIENEIAKFDGYPEIKIEDYAEELATVKENFLNDVDEGNDASESAEPQPFGDLGKESKREKFSFYYACVVGLNASDNQPFCKKDYFPAVILYSKDEEYLSNPREYLKTVAAIEGLSKEERAENFNMAVNGKKHSIAEIRVPPEWTEGRLVYLTGALVLRSHLPQFRITDRIMPVVVANGSDCLIYSVHKDYWTEGLISSFVHGSFGE